MKSFAFGSLNFDRQSVPEELRDMTVWPGVDEIALGETDRDVYRRKELAIRQFLLEPDVSVQEICRQNKISPATLYRSFERCTTKHPDGRIYGFRALVPYARLEPYKRTKAVSKGVSPTRGGMSGALNMLLERHPKIREMLKKELRDRNKPLGTTIREVRKSLKRIHKKFLEACRAEKIGSDEYPFNQDYLGLRSLARYLKKQADQTSFELAARDAGAARIGAAFPSAEHLKLDPALNPFEVVEFDGHKLDLRLTLKVQDPYGMDTYLEVSRIWILVVIEVVSRAILGYAVAFGSEYNKDDVATALQASLTPHVPRKISIPGLKVRDSGGYPSNVISATQYACWEWFRFDNAKSHLSIATLERLCEIVGCWTDAGPKGEPNSRPYVERFFSLLAAHFAHRVVGSTGASTTDIVRQLAAPEGGAELLMTLDELEDLVEVLFADYNGEAGPSGRTPLEVLSHLVAKRDGFLRTIPREVRGKLNLLHEARIVTVRGSLAEGTRPHVNFEHVRYSSDVLSGNPGLIGQKLRIYFDPRDIRVIHAFFEDGSELGVLTAAKPWCYTPHSLRVRQEIFRLKALGKLCYKEGDDPIEAWVKYKRRQSVDNKRARNDLAKQQKRMEQESSRTSKKREQKSDQGESGHDTAARESDTPPKPRPITLKRTFTF